MKDTVVIKVEMSRSAARLLADLDWTDESLARLSEACEIALSSSVEDRRNSL